MKQNSLRHIIVRRTVRVMTGFIILGGLLVLAGRMHLSDLILMCSVGGVLGYLMIEDDMRIIHQIKTYFAHKTNSETDSELPPFTTTQNLSDAHSPVTELAWQISVSEQQHHHHLQQLRLENNYLSNTIRNLPFPLILLDRDGYVLEFNRRAEDIFRNIQNRKPISFFIYDRTIIERIEAVGQSDNAFDEAEFTPQENRKQIFDLLISQFSADNRSQTALIFIDRSEAKATEQMRVDFVANVSHELRTPLTSVLGFVETLKGPAGEDAETREKFLNIVENQAARMIRLVADQLSLSSIERIEAIQPRSHLDLNLIAERVRETLSGVAREQGCHINIIQPDHPVMVIAEQDEMIQMVQNLLENAIRYGGDAAEVRIRITAQAEPPKMLAARLYASVSVEDDGEGIDAEHLPRLTERFYRIDKDRSRTKGGTGLGLAIVKHIANRHRGHLQITSQVGQGSQFTVYLPLSDTKPGSR